MKTTNNNPIDGRAARLKYGLAAACALILTASQGLAQTTLSYGNGTTLPATQLTGNWNTANVWYNGSSWTNWVDGSIARFYSPAGGPFASITLGSAVSLAGMTKVAEGAHYTVIAQGGYALNFANNSTISVSGNTLATQNGAISGNNLLVTGVAAGSSAVRFGPFGGDETIANTINGLTLDTITLQLSKGNGTAAVGGAVVVNSGDLQHGANQANRKNNQYAAGSTLTINGGTVTFHETTQTLDSLTWNGGNASFVAGAALNLGGDNALTLRGGLTLTNTSVNLTKNGTQTVRFDATNNGTAGFGSATSLVLGGGVKTFNVENGTAMNDMQVLVNSITETAASSIRKTGAGVVAWNVSGANTYSGGMSVDEGALFFTRQAALPSSGVTVSNGATLGLRRYGAEGFTEQQFLDLHAGTMANVTMGATAYAGWENQPDDPGQISATLTGTRGLAKLGGGNLTLTGENTYTGGTWINQGTLQIGAGGTTGSITGNVVMTSSAESARQLTFNRSDDLTYGGDISGSGSLRKEGAGTLTLTGNHSYTGTTTVSAGSLIVNGNQSGATGGLNVLTNATLGGSGTIGGATTISGIHSPGNSAGVQTFNSGLTYATDSTFVWELFGNTAAGRSTSFDGVDVTGGTLTINTGVTSSLVFNGSGSTVLWSDNFWDSNQTWLVFDNANLPSVLGIPSITIGLDSLGNNFAVELAGSTFAWDVQGNDIYLNYVVPEPSTYALLALAAAGLGAHVVRRRRTRAAGR